MDGNGRWARARGQLRLSGHKAGAKATKEIVKHAAMKGIKVLSIFAFSSENWQRPKKEVGFLMDLFVHSLKGELNSLNENQVKLCFTGEKNGLSDKLIKAIQDAEALTEHNKGMVLNVVFNYGGKWDIVQATKKIVGACLLGELDKEAITEDVFAHALATKSLPSPDLLIRTSGECRISNFFLWQLAYAELYFCECYWPDFSPKELDKALLWYQDRERRFGLLKDQKGDEHA
jgi:undecaprenyl diphosphate synthase